MAEGWRRVGAAVQLGDVPQEIVEMMESGVARAAVEAEAGARFVEARLRAVSGGRRRACVEVQSGWGGGRVAGWLGVAARRGGWRRVVSGGGVVLSGWGALRVALRVRALGLMRVGG
ncbi:hypothetical protein [Paragemmobacter straminiformis]|uniref:Uncharacterized protein n=1 Tax=Paragemmobacter straminiformis TaxID=2045119 RepID=A0A842ICI3_9RHOB|nr:hypothetical protein [Gemmobacter straminiformis]MBC2837289.1 hypothetical protein [Gemmobacter straminiformis]